MRLFIDVKTAVPGAVCPKTLEIGMSFIYDFPVGSKMECRFLAKLLEICYSLQN